MGQLIALRNDRLVLISDVSCLLYNLLLVRLVGGDAIRLLAVHSALGEDVGDDLSRSGTAVNVVALAAGAGHVDVVANADVLADNAISGEVTVNYCQPIQRLEPLRYDR